MPRLPHAWYAADARDASLEQFGRGLGDALGESLPSLTVNLSFVEALASSATTAGSAEVLADLLSDVLRRELTEDLVLVLDNAHELGRDTGSARLLESLCHQAPAALHVVLSSRQNPPFPVERLRGAGEVVAIEASELLLSAQEVRDVLRYWLGAQTEELAGGLHEVTGGWPAAVRLAVERLRVAPPDEHRRLLGQLRRPGGDVFSYLAEEVFSREPPQVRALLRTTAPFDRLTVGLCRALWVDQPEETTAGMVRRGLLVEQRTEAGEAWFRLPDLVREFALANWPVAEEESREVHRRAAVWFESRGLIEDALRSLAAAGRHEEIARLISAEGDRLVAAGGSETVVRFIDLLSEELRSAPIDQIAGAAHAIRGDIDRALECFHQAAGEEVAIPAALGWRMLMAHYFRDNLEQALEVFARTRIERADTADEALLLAWAASVHLRLGDPEACRTLGRRAMEAAAACGDLVAVAEAHIALALVEGPQEEAGEREAHLEQAIRVAERTGNVVQLIRARNNMGSILLEECAYLRALEELDSAIQLAELAGFAKMHALALLNRGLAYWCLGRLDEAAADYQRALSIYRKTGSREACYALTGLADIHRERGNLALARAGYEEALPLAERSGDRQGVVPALYQLAKVLIDEDPDRAIRLAERAVAYGWPDYPWALNTVGWIALGMGDPARARKAADEAGSAARERHDLWGLAESLALQAFASADPGGEAGPLGEALRIYREIGSELRGAEVELALAELSSGPGARAAARRAERKLREFGAHTAASRAAGVLWALRREERDPVVVETLGGFRLLRRGQPVEAVEWQSKKARDVLKILIARRGRPTPREMLMELLWPEGDPDKLGNRLSVAMATLRSVLDPDRRFDSEWFVAGAQDSLALDLRHVSVDVEEFLAEARAALAMVSHTPSSEAIEMLESAEARYAGDFLEGDLYEEWATPLREEARALYLSVAGALGAAAAASGKHDIATRYHLRILEKDPYDEAANLKLVSALERAGRHGEARRQYRTYVGRMREIEVEAASFPASARD